jgi:hypothetical protein
VRNSKKPLNSKRLSVKNLKVSLPLEQPEINWEEMKNTNFEMWFRYNLQNEKNLEWIDKNNYAFTFYKTDVGYWILNNYLRNIEVKPPLDMPTYINIYKIVQSGGASNIIKFIDESMDNKQTGMQVFRGIKRDKNFDIEPGNSYIERSYSSTTSNFCIAKSFINSNCCILSFRIPDNILSYDFKNNPQDFYSQEEEILIERNIVYHIGNPLIINDVYFYPCVISHINSNENLVKSELENQYNYLKYFKQEYKRLKSGTAQEILENLEKNRKYTFAPLLPNFDGDYNSLCLDNTMKSQVYELAKKKYKK